MMVFVVRIFGLVCIAVGLLHIVMGLGAEQLLGAGLDDAALTNPSLDSQNRFYGAQFTLVGAASWICASDLRRQATLFRLVMAVFFLGGLARLTSLAVHGWPSLAIQFLGLTELVMPPILLLWHSAFLRKES